VSDLKGALLPSLSTYLGGGQQAAKTSLLQNVAVLTGLEKLAIEGLTWLVLAGPEKRAVQGLHPAQSALKALHCMCNSRVSCIPKGVIHMWFLKSGGIL
jgi:hypothetical protein